MYFLNIFIIGAVALVFHLAAYMSFHTPKNFIFIISVAVAFVVYWGFHVMKRQRTIVVSIIEILLIVRLIWLIITNPSMVTHPSNLVFWILLSLMLFTFLTRQIAYAGKDRNSESIKLTSERMIKYFLRTLWIIGIFQAFYGFYQLYIFRNVHSPLMKTPMIGTIGTANAYGLFLAVSIIAALSDIRSFKRRVYQILLCSGILLMFVALVFNRSRGALLGLVVAGLIIVFFILVNEKKSYTSNKLFMRYIDPVFTRFKNKRFSLIVILSVIFIGLSGFGFFLYKLNPESSKGRIMAWEVSAPMVVDHPVFGVGHGRFAREYLYYQAEYFKYPENQKITYKAANLKQAHNEYLQAFCESGILGGLLFLSIWVIAIWRFYRHLRNDGNFKARYYCLAGILMIVLVHAIVDTPLHVLPISVVTYGVLGLAPVGSLTYLIKIRKRVLNWVLLVLFIGYTGFMLIKGFYQYPGYIVWKKGLEHRKKYQWKSAVDYYRPALKKLPQKGGLQFVLGAALGMMGNYKEAVSFLVESLENYTERNIFLSLSFAALRMKNYKDAEQYAQTSSYMFPDHLMPYLLLGEIFFYQNKIIFSKVCLQKCINRQTRIQSVEVMQISRKAKELWEKFYGNEY
jgi:O-antigen ligase